MAKKGVNKVILIGNCGDEPSIRYMPDGNAVATVSLATSDTWKDRNTGEPQERTEWHRVVFFGKIAEVVAQYVHKGSKLYIEGRLVTRKWTDQQNIERYTTEIVVDMGGTMQLLDSRPENAGSYNQNQQQAPQNRPQQNKPSLPLAPSDYPDYDPEEIPF